MDPELSAKANEAMPVVPPSTAEVSIRTLNSDLELIGHSGGMPMPQFARVPVPVAGPSILGPAGVPMPQAGDGSGDPGTMRALIWTIVILLGAGLLFVLGYYFAPMLLKK